MGSQRSRPAPGPSKEDFEREKNAREKLERQMQAMQQQDREKDERMLKLLQDEKDQSKENIGQMMKLLEDEKLQSQKRDEAVLKQQQETAKLIEQLQREYDDAQRIIQEKEEDLRNYPLPMYMQDYTKFVNVAITGAAGVGKSSFVNALRRIKSTDPAFAQVGESETTMKATPYQFPMESAIATSSNCLTENNAFDVGDKVVLQNMGQPELNGKEAEIVQIEADQVVVKCEGRIVPARACMVKGKLHDCVLWDLPGAGTPKFPQKNYVQIMGIRHFDLVALLTADRFTEAEAKLMKELKDWDVPFVAVRTRIDQAIDAAIALKEEDLEDDGELDNESKVKITDAKVEEVKQVLKQEFKLANIYTISTLPKLRKKYDFLLLENDMQIMVKNQRGLTSHRTCPVCFLDYSEYGGVAGERVAANPCLHTVCSDCWADIGDTCPICRRTVTVPRKQARKEPAGQTA